jgi:hypothetical protein|tara:strand:- start:515 stop:700 length:186 start_codon:yes stop_codon:yes gene_type:complete
MKGKDWQKHTGKGQADMGLSIGSVVFITPPVKDKNGNVKKKGSTEEISWEQYMELKLDGKL